jgi:hypothetical protein
VSILFPNGLSLALFAVYFLFYGSLESSGKRKIKMVEKYLKGKVVEYGYYNNVSSDSIIPLVKGPSFSS